MYANDVIIIIKVVNLTLLCLKYQSILKIYIQVFNFFLCRERNTLSATN